MKRNLKFEMQKVKLINFIILNLILLPLIFIPATSGAEYKIYLKNGRTISGIEEIKHENGNVKIFKEGILLDMPKANILKIEEYKPAFVEKKSQEEGGAESGEKPVESQTPDYTDYRRTYKTAPVEEQDEEITEGKEEETKAAGETENTGEEKQSKKSTD